MTAPYTSIKPTANAVPSNPSSAHPAANTAATYLLTGAPGLSWRISQLTWSYTGTPAAGAFISIAWSTFVIAIPIVAGGPGQLNFDPCWMFPANTNVTITLAAGGSGVSGVIVPPNAWQE